MVDSDLSILIVDDTRFSAAVVGRAICKSVMNKQLLHGILAAYRIWNTQCARKRRDDAL